VARHSCNSMRSTTLQARLDASCKLWLLMAALKAWSKGTAKTKNSERVTSCGQGVDAGDLIQPLLEESSAPCDAEVLYNSVQRRCCVAS
jgi:hypothetical protein